MLQEKLGPCQRAPVADLLVAAMVMATVVEMAMVVEAEVGKDKMVVEVQETKKRELVTIVEGLDT